MTLLELRAEAEKYIEPEPNSGCWLWIGPRLDGYAELWRNKKHHLIHRLMYVLARGPVARGLELDHLCRVRCCVNPTHLEAVSHQVNMLRGRTLAAHEAAQTHCKRGHLFDAENTRLALGSAAGRRVCRACMRWHVRISHQRAVARNLGLLQ